MNVGGWSGDEGLRIAEDLVVFLRRDVTEVQSGDDGAVWKRKRPVAVGLDRYIVTQHGGETVQVAFLVSHGDQLPLAVAVRNLDSEDRDGRAIVLSRCGAHVAEYADSGCK